MLGTPGALLAEYSAQIPKIVRSMIYQPLYYMPDIRFFLSDSSTYLHNLDTSAWFTGTNFEHSQMRRTPSITTQVLDNDVLSRVQSLLNNHHPWSVGYRRPLGRGRGSRNQQPAPQNSDVDRQFYNFWEPYHVLGAPKCPR